MNNKLKISHDACGKKICNMYVQLALHLDHRRGRIVQTSYCDELGSTVLQSWVESKRRLCSVCVDA